jgi:hypothetical protein
MHALSLTSGGVQMLNTVTAASLAGADNEHLLG